MGISGEDIKTKVMLRLNQNGLASKSTDKLLNMYIDSVVMEIAAESWYDDLLKTKEDITTDADGKFEIEGNIIPYLMFAYGTEDQRHSWQRLTPVSFEYFASWDNRIYRGASSYGGGAGGGYRRRYSLIYEGDPDNTTMQILEIQNEVNIKCIYYPIRPAISDFPNYFEPLITNRVIELYTLDFQEASNDRYVKLLQDRTKELTKKLKKQANTVEVNAYDRTIRNAKTRDWIDAESNDIGYWIP